MINKQDPRTQHPKHLRTGWSRSQNAQERLKRDVQTFAVLATVSAKRMHLTAQLHDFRRPVPDCIDANFFESSTRWTPHMRRRKLLMLPILKYFPHGVLLGSAFNSIIDVAALSCCSGKLAHPAKRQEASNCETSYLRSCACVFHVCVHAIGVLGRRETTYYQLMKTPGGVCGRFFANVQRSSAVYILAKVGGGTAEDGPTKILKSVVLYRAPLVIPSRQGRVGRCNRW